MGPQFRIARLALISFSGALILEIVLTFALGLREAFTVRQIPAHLAALLVGGLAGWLFELLRESTKATAEILAAAQGMQTNFETVANKIQYQERALDMLTACPRHNAAISQLLKSSISENFRRIPSVGVPEYLAFLRLAIVHSDGYEGIQRNTLSWFRDSKRGSYLNNLRQRNMRYKTRLFIIDDEQREEWKADLNDQESLSYYWRNTGNVDTYWIFAQNFSDNFPAWGEEVPEDLALYDHQLLISYDEKRQLLSFNVVGTESEYPTLFQTIQQMARDGIPALHRLHPPSYLP